MSTSLTGSWIRRGVYRLITFLIRVHSDAEARSGDEASDAASRGDKSAVAKHEWTEDHPIHWDDTWTLQHAK